MGALEFTGRSQRAKGRLCNYEGHRGTAAAIGRHRVNVAGYPLRTDHGDLVYVCSRCRETIEDVWSSATAPSATANSPSIAQEAA